MNNYSKVLTFFVENGIQLSVEQLAALKEEFLYEATVAQIATAKNNPKAIAKYNKGLAKQMDKTDNSWNDLKKSILLGGSYEDNKKLMHKAADTEDKLDKNIGKVIDKDEKAAYKENEKKIENRVQLNKEQLEKLKEEFLNEGALKKLIANRTKNAMEATKNLSNGPRVSRKQMKAEEEYLEKLSKIGDQSTNDIMKNYIDAYNNTSEEGIEKARENIRKAKKDLSNNNLN